MSRNTPNTPKANVSIILTKFDLHCVAQPQMLFIEQTEGEKNKNTTKIKDVDSKSTENERH